ncbi:BF2992 family fimbrillin-A clan protein [Bacteroides cellulosilyticus]|uniref:BF2992 family fimbrillin-A clan protein n=1 Tax=Bacteroides cellulosilyticus TaxID=246787 RepID=UPI00234E07DB|nr:BF2992 family fimbrillin-A clan protein [Bacteroides cellulosilyticus]MDC7176301.1 BF2992 family fimbrillin-A clan protein [Bacteroides cellulosilyticus]MDC7179993.1 BF2992 family fimbrillin-A clan protein [Bacteroides cellulosilyticus]
MKRYLYAIMCLLLLAACSRQGDLAQQPSIIPEGMVEVRFLLPGMLTASPMISRTAPAEEIYTPDGTLLNGKKELPLEEGTTLWLLIEGWTGEEPSTGEKYKTLKSYVVKGQGLYQSLYPCEVNEKGEVKEEMVTPLYLPFGTYTFRALSPAKAFLDSEGRPITDLSAVDVFRQKVTNGDYLISNDERYVQTCLKKQTIEPTNEKVQVIELNPLINQTAQLKFTIYTDPADPYIHKIKMMPAGIEICGLQDMYGNEEGKKLWNWSPELADTLVAYPGKKDELLTIGGNDKNVTQINNKEVVIETAVLPTDATSSSIIVIFNMEVNGIPTQYEMMLNLKILRAAFSYHYKGKLTTTEGITAITWQNVSWSANVEIDDINQKQ